MNELKKLWKQNPVLIVVGVAVIGFVLYYIYQQNNSGGQPNNAVGAGSYYVALTPSDSIGTPPTGSGISPTPTPQTNTYTITSADKAAFNGHTLHSLATKFGITYDQLWSANSPTPLGTDKNHAKWSVGTVLVIPKPGHFIPAGSQ